MGSTMTKTFYGNLLCATVTLMLAMGTWAASPELKPGSAPNLEIIGSIEGITHIRPVKNRATERFQVKVKVIDRWLGDWKDPVLYFGVHSPSRDLEGVDYRSKGSYKDKLFLFIFKNEAPNGLKFEKILTPFYTDKACSECGKKLQWFSTSFGHTEERQYGYCPQHGQKDELGLHFAE